MATLAANVLTLADWAKTRDPDGKTADIVELLSQTNPILDDILYVEGNESTGHRITSRTGLPTVAWRLLNSGTQPSKSTTAQTTESIGMLEAWSEVDQDLAELENDVNAFRFQEGQAFVESMNIEMASTLFYGNSGTAPEEFTGLAVRYSDLSAANAQNIIVGGGSGADNSSIWLVGWGAKSAFCMFPKGSMAGLLHEDYGKVTVETTAGIAGNRMRAYQERWQWKMGFALKDWRYTVRIPNIDISALVAKSSAADLVELMIKAVHAMQDFNGINAIFYMNRTCFQMLDIQRRDTMTGGTSGGSIVYMDVDGKAVPTFRGIPIRVTDALTEAEALVS